MIALFPLYLAKVVNQLDNHAIMFEKQVSSFINIACLTTNTIHYYYYIQDIALKKKSGWVNKECDSRFEATDS